MATHISPSTPPPTDTYTDIEGSPAMMMNRSTRGSTSFSRQISAIGAKISRALGHDEGEEAELGDGQSIITLVHETTSLADRSQSRGREFQSSGRGGIGNIRQSSQSQSRDRSVGGPDDFSQTRGREPAVDLSNVYSTGRGGAGNIRSPSRDHHAPTPPDQHEIDVLRSHVEAAQNGIHSSGRGGVGNISNSRSRSRGPRINPLHRDSTGNTITPLLHANAPPLLHSTGRGGAGNIIPGDGVSAELYDEEERERVGRDSEPRIHSTGRGGAANLTQSTEPPIEHHPHPHQPGELESTGRGGAGNVRDRSVSRPPGDRSPSRHPHAPTHSHSHTQSQYEGTSPVRSSHHIHAVAPPTEELGLVRTRTRGDGNSPAKGEKVPEKAHTGISGFFHKALHHKDAEEKA